MLKRSPDGGGTRAALLRAAVDVIAEQGWQGAGARAVSERAGVALGALNYHFTTKQALFRQATMDAVTDMFATPAAIMRDSVTVEELVEDMIGWSRSADVSTTQQVVLLEVMLRSRRDPALSVALAEALLEYRRHLGDALARVLGTDDVLDEALTEALIALCDGLFLHTMIEPTFPHHAAADVAAKVWAAYLEDHHLAGLPAAAEGSARATVRASPSTASRSSVRVGKTR